VIEIFMARFVHLLTIVALLLYSIHSMTSNVQAASSALPRVESSHHSANNEHHHSGQRAMPVCVICLAAGISHHVMAQPIQSDLVVEPSLIVELNGKHVRPPVPPPRLLI
jgi:hypothetical protein